MAHTLTESQVRSRVNLTHENLEDIKSLSLPGTFHEKIISIGTSLNKFTRIKSLDFSRNGLESLKGLEHLELLEKLNLYYNNVSSLEELSRLKHNQNLKDLDLRLNPVSRHEPDYRLNLIHMLPNLQKLDDRGVRDRERQAALTHFSSAQASEMNLTVKEQKSKCDLPKPRPNSMARLMKNPFVLIDDEEAMIDTMKQNQGDFSKPRPLTGSAAKKNEALDYSLEDLKKLDEPRLPKYQPEEVKSSPKSVQKHQPPSRLPESPEQPEVNSLIAGYLEKYPNIMASPPENLKKIAVEPVSDPNLRYVDETAANTKYKGQGFFTPHPDGPQEEIPRDSREHAGSMSESQLSLEDPVETSKSAHKRANSVPNVSLELSSTLPFAMDLSQDQEKVLLNSLLNLVDRYWNGSKSLHKHQKFIEHALKCVSDYSHHHRNDIDVDAMKIKLRWLEDENQALRRQRQTEQVHQSTLKETELKHALKRAREDVERLHEELKQYVRENVALRKELEDHSLPTMYKQNNAGGAAESSGPLQGMMEELQRQNSGLSREVEVMRSKIKQYGQLQEVTSMLQESHRSLVETNEHLLQEMKTMKHKHQDEIRHMQWSYQQLKGSITQHHLPYLSSIHHNLNKNNTTTASKSNGNNNNRISSPGASNNNIEDTSYSRHSESHNEGGDEESIMINDRPSVQMY